MSKQNEEVDDQVVDIEPYEGEPDADLARAREDGSQDEVEANDA